MRNYILVCVISLMCSMLIAAAKPERYVKDNEFHSSYPKLSLKINPMYKYLGLLEYAIEVPSADRLQPAGYDTKSYIFIDSVDSRMKKALYIQIRREQTKYVGNLLGDLKVNLKSGTCDLGEKEYQCYTRVISPSNDEPIAKFILDNGYTLPECLLTRVYARVDTSNGNNLIIISYNEDLSGSGFDCKTWQVTDRLTNVHKQYSDQFERRSRASFEIIKKGSLRDRKQKLYQDEDSMRDRFIPSRDQP